MSRWRRTKGFAGFTHGFEIFSIANATIFALQSTAAQTWQA